MPRKNISPAKTQRNCNVSTFFAKKKIKKTDEKITLRFKIQFSISKLENAPEPIPVPNPIAKKISTSRKK